MNVLLIDPPGWQKHSLNLGLAYLAGALRAADIDVRILDMNNHSYSDERVRRIITDYNPKVIGISVKTATANISSQIVRALKGTFPHVIYVAGGPHITLCGEEFIREHKEIDFGITGEGEYAFVRLLNNIRDNAENISGMNRICPGEKTDISQLAFPAFEHVMDMDFTDFRYPLLTSRGCPYGCIFCCVGLISGRKWRAREPDDVVRELAQAKDNYQMQSFEIMDDNFTLDIDRAKNICRRIIKSKLNLDWWCHNGLRADKLDRELLNLMRKAGCKSIALGIESGDQAVFSTINKGEELSDIVRAVRMVQKAGIKCVGYFIVGLPGDSVESTKRSVKLQRDLKLADHKFNMLMPYPGTRIWDMVEEKGSLLTDIQGAYHFGENKKIFFGINNISKKTLEQCMYLAENQEWVSAEKDLVRIRDDFRARFGRDIKRVLFVESDLRSSAEYIDIECKNADVIRIEQNRMQGEIKDKYMLEPDAEGSYFDVLLNLVREEDYNVIFEASRKRLLIQRASKEKNEYIRDEMLPSPREWDGSSGKYFAMKLKNMSPDIPAAKNGLIYKDGIVLPFCPYPEWEKIPCGKIESGLAFISLAAFNRESTYKTDYLTPQREPELRELIIPQNRDSALERIIGESDILFCPEGMTYFSQVFSRAKINAIYFLEGQGPDSLKYETLERIHAGRWYYLIKKLKNVTDIKPFIRRSVLTAGKCGKVFILWVQILAIRIAAGFKDFVSGLVRF